MLRYIGICLAALAAVVLLKNIRTEYAFAVKFAVLVLLGVPIAALAFQVIQEVRALSAQAQIDETMLLLLIKALGISIVAQVASNVCSDCGESALALCVEMLGRGSILLMALPLAGRLLSWCMTWINV